MVRKFGMAVAQLKTFNGLQTDKIRVNQMLKIPTLAELSAIAPPVKKQKPVKSTESATGSEAGAGSVQLSLQIFLDREQFSAGPIAGEPGPAFAKVLLLYQSTHEDARDDASLDAKPRAALGNVFTRYKLTAEDFCSITPSKADTIVAPKRTPVPAHVHPGKLPSKPAAIAETYPTYEDLPPIPFLPYPTPSDSSPHRFHRPQPPLLTPT